MSSGLHDSPIIMGIAMVKNEQDIIEPFVRHNLRFLDYLIVINNGSVDRTREILLMLSRELGNVIVTDDNEFGYTQSERMTRLLHGCQSAFFSDYAIPLDADEFIQVKDRATLCEVIDQIPCGGFGLVPWRTFVVTPGTLVRCAEDPPKTMEWRRRAEAPEYTKAILRLDGRVDRALVLEQGNHAVRSLSGGEVPHRVLNGLALQHFPVRSRNQLVAKTVVGWMAYLAKDPQARESPQGFGYQWRIHFDRFAKEGGIENPEVCELSFLYAQAPRPVDWKVDVVADNPPSDYSRQYSTGQALDAAQLIARSWERSLIGRATVPNLVRATTSFRGAAQSIAPTAFDPSWHWDNLFVDVPPFQYIAEKYQPATALDIGCGIGAYLQLFKNMAVSNVFGVDGLSQDATALDADEYLAQDLSQPLRLGRAFDIVISIEVAEHLPAASADCLLDNIASHAKDLIVFSAAELNQPGHGHINCRPLPYWLEKWRSRGWAPHVEDTLAIRALASLSWFRRNLVVLRRCGVSGLDPPSRLEQIADKRFVWYGQQPGVRKTAFLETPPAGTDYV